MIRRFLFLLLLMPLVVSASAQTDTTPNGFTTDQLIEAYINGQFRTIETTGWFTSHAEGTLINVYNDGIYRVSDGERIAELDDAIFSPDDRYVANLPDGIFQTDTLDLVVDLTDPVLAAQLNSARYPSIRFSQDSAFAAIVGVGVFRLEDGEQIIGSDSDRFSFSRMSRYVATVHTVYSLDNGEAVIQFNGYEPQFTNDDTYVYILNDGVYRLEDSEKVIDATGVAVFVSPSGEYAAVLGDGIYGMETYEKLFSLGSDRGYPVFSLDGEYVAFGFGNLYRLSDGEALLPVHGSWAIFTQDSQYVALPHDGVYHLGTGEPVLQFSIRGCLPRFSTGENFLASAGICRDDSGGVYRMRDGSLIAEVPVSASIELSPDETTVTVIPGGVYDLSTGEQLSPVLDRIARYTDDSRYVYIDQNAYRIEDGQRFPGLRFLDIEHGLLGIGNIVIIIDETVSSTEVNAVRTITTTAVYEGPDRESPHLANINLENLIFAVLDERNGWYQIGTNGQIGWISGEHVERVTLPLVERPSP